jgi:Arc/MetJ-type ribon-helix-helix transcriptional regulator
LPKSQFLDHESGYNQYLAESRLAGFARADAEASAFDSMSEYMRELIRRRREAKIAEDLAMLQKAIEGAPSGDPSEAEMREIYQVAKKGRRR